MPSRVMLIRHAEKPKDDNDIHLTPAGRERSYRLVDLFGPGGRLRGAQFLFATDRSKHSNRCVETLTPLATATHMDLNHEWEDDEYGDLAKRLKSAKKYRDATVLICWHHGNIPALAKALGVKTAELPWRKWPDDVFDAIWIIDFDAAGKPKIRSESQDYEASRVGSGEQQRADDPGALVADNNHAWAAMYGDVKRENARLAEQLRQMTQMRDHAQDTLQDTTAELAEQLQAARAEAAALRPYARHKNDCALGKELADGRTRVFVDSGGPLPPLDPMTHVYVNWTPPCDCDLDAALAPQEPRHE